jgi:uncharacterized protein (DUF1499 family)
MQNQENLVNKLSPFSLITTIILGAIALFLIIQLLTGGKISIFAGSQPTNIGVVNGQLAACPSSPNCVSSYSQDSHYIAPLSYTGSGEQAIKDLTNIINSLPRTKIIEVTDNYIYSQFTSQLMGYVDDVEFYLDSSKSVIQVRSASRLGESDLGANRARIENIRELFTNN